MATYKREDPRRVVFCELSEQCDEALLHELAIQFGPVANLSWPTTSDASGTAQRMSYCFVDFVSPEDAKYCFEALYRSQVRLFEKEIRVIHCSVTNEQATRSAEGALHEIGAKVLVRNVDYAATEFDITSFFEQFGPFAAPPRMRRDLSGNFRGTVIVSYKTFAASDRMIEQMNGRVYRDRILSVQYAEMEDGSGRLHGSEEERQNADLVREQERQYQAHLSQEVTSARMERQASRQGNTAWAEKVDLYGSHPRALPGQ